jgi:HK97 family phage portal protein
VNFLKILKKRKKGIAKSMSQFDAFDRSNGFVSASSLATSNAYLNAYKTINYISTMTGILSSDIAGLDYRILNKKGEVAGNDDFEELINQPNEDLTGYELRQVSMLHLLLDGNLFWLPESGDAFANLKQRPSMISVLNPAEVDIVSNGTIINPETITSYNEISYYQATGYLLQVINNKILNKDAVVHLKTSSPYNTLRGMGKIQANAPMLEIDKYQNIFNRAFFSQGAMSNLAAMQKEDLGPTQFELWKKSIDMQYQGLSNMHKIMKLPPNTEIKPLNMSHKDMDFLAQKEMTRQDVANIFELPPVISGDLNKVQGYSSTQQMKRYFKNTLPKHARQLAFAYQNILKRFDSSLTFQFKYPVAMDRKEESEVGQSLFDRGAISQNEYREMLGLPIIEDDESNQRFIKKDYVNIENLERLNSVNIPSSSEKSVDSVSKIATKKELANFNRDNFVRFSRKSRSKIEKKMVKDIAGFYKAQGNRVISGLNKSAVISDMYNVSSEIKIVEAAAKKMFTSALTLSYNDLNEYFDLDFDASTKNPIFNNQVATLTDELASTITASRKREIERLLNNMAEEGLSLTDLKNNIEDLYGTLDSTSGSRAMRIARTEASRTWDKATFQSYKQLDVQFIDVVDCEDSEPDCNKKNVPMSEVEALKFHPNHTGVIVPNE